jgi:hypothetical protein
VTTLTVDQRELDALEELFGPGPELDELVAEAELRLGSSDVMDPEDSAVYSIPITIIWTIMFRC